MLPVVDFLLGLLIGIGFWLWQKIQSNRKLQQLLKGFQTNDPEIALPVIPRLRREIALQNQRQQELSLKAKGISDKFADF